MRNGLDFSDHVQTEESICKDHSFGEFDCYVVEIAVKLKSFFLLIDNF